MLTRELIADGRLQRLAAAGTSDMPVLGEAELRASLAAMMDDFPVGADLWVFGYGSLLWNPAFHFVEHRVGCIHGYHRRFCLEMPLGRGTPHRPCPMLGLDRGGSCCGVAFRIARVAAWTEAEVLWRREMIIGAYQPRWVTVELTDRRVRAITFAADRRHPVYGGALPEATVAIRIREATGPLGSCAEYLLRTAAALAEYGITDPRVIRLLGLAGLLPDSPGRPCPASHRPALSQ